MEHINMSILQNKPLWGDPSSRYRVLFVVNFFTTTMAVQNTSAYGNAFNSGDSKNHPDKLLNARWSI